jgi:hypothetical protein
MAYYTGPRRKKKVDPSLVRRRSTAEQFENALSRVKLEDTLTVPSSQFKIINGIPNKFKDGRWVPLTKM